MPNQYVTTGKNLIKLLLIVALLTSCSSNSSNTTNPKNQDKSLTEGISVERGAYLVQIQGCNDCHTPKIMGPQGFLLDSNRLLSGFPAKTVLPPIDQKVFSPNYWALMGVGNTCFVGPWGLTMAANLTSDTATGIGAWSEGNFLQAMRMGKHMGYPNARPILPPMPWKTIGQNTDDDLKSIFAYLKSTTPIENRVPPPVSPAELQQQNSKHK